MNEIVIKRKKLIYAFLISALFLGIALFLYYWLDIRMGKIMRDPVSNPSIGFISQAGILFWSASAAICLFTANIIKSNAALVEWYKALLFVGLLTLMLGLDDVFLLHELIFPAIGIPEKGVILTYGVILLTWLAKYKNLLKQTEYHLLVIALVFLGLGAVSEKTDLELVDKYFFEDATKFIGIVSWFVYLSHLSTYVLKLSRVPVSSE